MFGRSGKTDGTLRLGRASGASKLRLGRPEWRLGRPNCLWCVPAASGASRLRLGRPGASWGLLEHLGGRPRGPGATSGVSWAVWGTVGRPGAVWGTSGAPWGRLGHV